MRPSKRRFWSRVKALANPDLNSNYDRAAHSGLLFGGRCKVPGGGPKSKTVDIRRLGGDIARAYVDGDARTKQWIEAFKPTSTEI